jgi:arabinogalactan endo-1,4-beta-galactosidase
MEEFITGADVSTLQQIEDFGGCFYEGDQKRDLLDILKEKGLPISG